MDITGSTTSVARKTLIFNAHSTTSILSGSLEKLPPEDDKGAEQRKRVLTSCWDAIEEEINTILSDQHGKVIDDLLHFISKSQKHLEDLYSRCKAAKRQELLLHQKKLLPPRLEISTAVLLAGVNMPDHDVLLKHLQAKIRDQISPYVVLLKSRDCNSGLKATMKNMMTCLMHSDEEAGQQEQSSTAKVILCSMNTLCSWYQESCDVKSKLNGSNSAKETRKPPVIIIIEDFEAFASHILQDLILSLRSANK